MDSGIRNETEEGLQRRKKYAERLQPEDLAEMWVVYKDLRAKGWAFLDIYEKLADQFGRPVATIRTHLRKLAPTTDIARVFLSASALKMAKRVVDEGRVPELIDVLSRPSLGVIAPKAEAQGGGGFFLSVSADSCGAVRVGLAGSGGGAHLLPESSEGADPPGVEGTGPELSSIIDVEPIENQPVTEKKENRHALQTSVLSERQLRAVRAARERLHPTQRSRPGRSRPSVSQEVGGLQGDDASPDGVAGNG